MKKNKDWQDRFREKYETECLSETRIVGGFSVDFDLDPWQLETWIEEYLQQELDRQREEIVKKLDKMIVPEYDPGYFQGIYDSIKVVLETKTDEETDTAIKQIKK